MDKEIRGLFYDFGLIVSISIQSNFHLKIASFLKAKAVLWRTLVSFFNENTNQTEEWYFEDGLRDYLMESSSNYTTLPEDPFIGKSSTNSESVEWAILNCLMEERDSRKLCQSNSNYSGWYPYKWYAIRNFGGYKRICESKSAAKGVSWHRRIFGIE